ncbi:MAG: DUF2098 domain-containing protein [Candidatus Methanofastidiosia archaeon]
MKMIEVGKYAKYTNTGTVGKIVDIIESGGKKFALLESTQLYYDIAYLQEITKPISKKKEAKKDIRLSEKANKDMMDAITSGEMSDSIGGG